MQALPPGLCHPGPSAPSTLPPSDATALPTPAAHPKDRNIWPTYYLHHLPREENSKHIATYQTRTHRVRKKRDQNTLFLVISSTEMGRFW